MRTLLPLMIIVIMLYFVIDSATQLSNNLSKRVDIFNSAIKGK